MPFRQHLPEEIADIPRKIAIFAEIFKKQNSMITQDQLKETEERKLALRRYL